METGVAEIVMQCFGGFRLDVDGKEIHNFGTDKTRALFVFLAIEAPRSFRRSYLAGLFWSDFSEEQALHSLRQTLVWLKKAIPRKADQPPLLITKQDSIAINPEVDLWVDLKTFDIAYQSTLKNLSSDQNLDCLNIIELQKAVSLFVGPFLERFSLSASPLFDEWVLTIQESSSQKAVHLMSLLCEYYERRADYDHASLLADRIIPLTPWDETAYMHSMHLFASRKQWAVAKKRYIQLKNYLSENFSIEPESSISNLYETIRHASLNGLSIPPHVPPVQSVLPEHPGSFFGRMQEISDLVSMCADPKIRLITLLGMGGIGKTQLAVEIGHQLHGLYNNGVFFISSAEVASCEELVYSIGESLRMTFSGKAAQQQVLLDYLREKRMFLILDGFENLLTDNHTCRLISKMLSQAPGLKLMITSRKRLNLHEEHIYQLGGLDFSPGESSPIQKFDPSDSVSLFIDRANKINHDFRLNQQSQTLVEKFCRLLEGHPLSIELIAASARVDNLPELFESLETNLLAIQSPMINGSPEHLSLDVVYERSWCMLELPEQEAMQRLSCFRSSFSKEAGLEVGQTTSSVLSALVDKCFLQKKDGERYYLHEIIRQFTLQKTIHANLYQAYRKSHAAYYLSYLNRISINLLSVYTESILEEIDKDLQNFIDAWEYFYENDILEPLINCIDPLHQFFNIRSRFQEGIDLFQRTLQAKAVSNSDSLLKIKLTSRIGSLAHHLRQNELAFQMFSNSIAWLMAQPDESEQGLAFIGLGDYYLRKKKFDLALQKAKKALFCFQKIGDSANQATAYKLLGLIHDRMANFSLAKEALSKSIEISKEINDRRGMIASLNMLGDLACNEGEYKKAEVFFMESLSYSQLFKDRFNQAILLNNLASVFRPQKDYQREESVLLESLAICREIGDQDGEAIALNNLGELAVVLCKFEKAIQYCQQSLEIALKMNEDWTIIINHDIMGEAYLAMQAAENAMCNFTKAVKRAYTIGSWDLLTRVIVNAAGVYRLQGDFETAQKFLSAALRHPAILYEFKIKALAWLKEMGFEATEESNPELLNLLLSEFFNLHPVN